MERFHSARHSSCLPIQLFGVEIHSLLPNDQCHGGHLSCQGETRHRRPHPFLYQSNIEIAEWSRPSTGRKSSAFEQIFQIVIMVVIQTAHGDALPVSYQLPSHEAVLTAVMSLDCETTVSPQLSLGTETVWRLQQRHEQGGTNRTDRRNLAQ